MIRKQRIFSPWPKAIAGAVAISAMAFLLYSPDVPAEPATDAAWLDDVALFERRIAIISMSCAACHGTDGRLRTTIPALAGRPAPVLHAQLVAFKADAMPGATVMPRLARGFSDEELKAVADFFAALEP